MESLKPEKRPLVKQPQRSSSDQHNPRPEVWSAKIPGKTDVIATENGKDSKAAPTHEDGRQIIGGGVSCSSRLLGSGSSSPTRVVGANRAEETRHRVEVHKVKYHFMSVCGFGARTAEELRGNKRCCKIGSKQFSC